MFIHVKMQQALSAIPLVETMFYKYWLKPCSTNISFIIANELHSFSLTLDFHFDRSHSSEYRVSLAAQTAFFFYIKVGKI